MAVGVAKGEIDDVRAMLDGLFNRGHHVICRRTRFLRVVREDLHRQQLGVRRDAVDAAILDHVGPIWRICRDDAGHVHAVLGGGLVLDLRRLIGKVVAVRNLVGKACFRLHAHGHAVI